MAGWIKINRDIADMADYLGEKFNRPMCWIDLILLAEVKPKEITIRGIKATVERGQIAISARELAYRWSLSVPTVLKRLKEFVGEGRVSVTKSNVVNIITILDYDSYQCRDEEQKPMQQDLFGQPLPVMEQDVKRNPSPMPRKHRYAPCVLLTEDEYGKLAAEHGEEAAKWMIRKLDDYKAAKGATYKSDYRAILNWVVREYQKHQQHGENTTYGQSVSSMGKARRDAEFANYIADKLGSVGLQGNVQDR